jgi:organic hydroperoxide reductase OsmC/OhrA
MEIATEGVVEKQDGGYRFTKLTLRPTVIIHQEADRERTGRLLEKAERICLIARSILATIVLEPKVQVEVPVAV